MNGSPLLLLQEVGHVSLNQMLEGNDPDNQSGKFRYSTHSYISLK